MKTASKYRAGVARMVLAALVSLALLAGCDRSREHSAQFFVFGTIVEVKLFGAGDEVAGQAFGDLQRMFQAMHSDWHAWEPGRLTRINDAFANDLPATADEHIVRMVEHSQLIEELTGGRFNPAIGALIRLWGFHTSEYPIIGPPPGQAEIDSILSHAPSSRDIRIDGLVLSTGNPRVQLDFGGIAKGYAVDLAIAHLRGMGIRNAIVNSGGDLRAIGARGDRPWRIAVRKPGGGIIGAVEVAGDEALFTSGNYERFRLDRTERYPHILDPRTGWPVRNVASATVITSEGLLADAAATALIVAGLDEWTGVARALELDQVMLIDEAGKVYMTPAMAKRLHFTGEVEQHIVSLRE